MFCNKPTRLYTIQYPELVITYEEGFNMQTGERNPLQSPEDEQYDKLSTQLFPGKLIRTQNKLLFPPLNSINNFATIEYDTHLNTKIASSLRHMYRNDISFPPQF